MFSQPVDSTGMNIKTKYNVGFDDSDGIELKSVITNSSQTNHDKIDSTDLDDDVDDDILTCADLMAFAWQVTKGMVRKLDAFKVRFKRRMWHVLTSMETTPILCCIVVILLINCTHVIFGV